MCHKWNSKLYLLSRCLAPFLASDCNIAISEQRENKLICECNMIVKSGIVNLTVVENLGVVCVPLNSLDNERKEDLVHSKVRAHMLKALETLDK